jgi:hypothetical protein
MRYDVAIALQAPPQLLLLSRLLMRWKRLVIFLLLCGRGREWEESRFIGVLGGRRGAREWLDEKSRAEAKEAMRPSRTIRVRVGSAMARMMVSNGGGRR